MTQENNGQNGQDFVRTRDMLRLARPQLNAPRLDEIKRDVLHRSARRGRPVRAPVALRRRVLWLSMFVMLVALSTSSAAAQALNWVSGGTLKKTAGIGGKTQGTSFFFGTYHMGGDSTDDAGHATYCPDDNGSTDKDSSSDGGHKSSYKSSSSKSSTPSKSGASNRITIQTGSQQGGGGSDSSENPGPCDPKDHSDSGHSSDGGDKPGYHRDGGGKDEKGGSYSGGKSSGKNGKG